jgi:hypothetical protein
VFHESETLAPLKQRVKVKVRKLLLGLFAYQSNHYLFFQVEKEADPESFACAFHSVDREAVMANLP